MLNLINEVSGHGACQAVTPDHDVDAGAGSCEEHRCLTSGIAAADHNGGAADAGLGFHLSGGIEDTRALELSQAV
jgi:hypothetical protein